MNHRAVDCGEVIDMAYSGKVPFVPDMEECRMTVECGDAVCCIMDAVCRGATEEERKRAVEQIQQLAEAALLRKAGD